MMKVSEMQAGPDLDALVAEKVMGGVLIMSEPWHHWDESPATRRLVRFPGEMRDVWSPLGDWSPSTDIAAAFEVVEKMRPVTIEDGGPEGERWCVRFAVDFMDEPSWDIAHGESDTLPLAICRAALVAVGAAK